MILNLSIIKQPNNKEIITTHFSIITISGVRQLVTSTVQLAKVKFFDFMVKLIINHGFSGTN